MFTSIQDAIVRKIATSFLLRWADGYKTEIMAVVHGVNLALLYLVAACAAYPLPLPQLVAVCGVVGLLNAKWVLLGTFLSKLGLVFGIADANAKSRLGIPDPRLISAERK